MDWEDCVVDVHSVKIAKSVLETLFKSCGSVRSVIHWKGQGEKPHVFFEYKSPGSADSARAIGLDRNDLQVIKISNNEMLKRKFRELAHGPLRERDSRSRPTGPSFRSTHAHLDREPSYGNLSGKDDCLPSKPTELTVYTGDRHGSGKYYEPVIPDDNRDVQRRPSTSTFIASSPSTSKQYHSKSSYWADKNTDRGDDLSKSRNSCSLGFPPVGSASYGTRINSPDKSLTILQIPHAGEIIKFDLDTQLEEDPTGIIRILSAVKADQKLWMMTAAYYKGKNNLQSAKKVLEAGIDTAVQLGGETDTKPFWHLLGKINSNIQALSSPATSAFTLSPLTSSFSSVANSSPEIVGHTFNGTGIQNNLSLATLSRDVVIISANTSSADAAGSNDTRGADGRPSKDSLTQLPGCTLNSQTHSVGSQVQQGHSSTFPVSPSEPTNTSSQLYSLKKEIEVLREKQKVMLEDLSHARVAKRRVEDEVKEERSIRRKLEKSLGLAEDALARSKRMEDAALDQVKREVESRRRAEGLLAELKARKDELVKSPVSDTGHSLFTSNPGDAAVLRQLASMIRGIPPRETVESTPNSSSVWFNGENSMSGHPKP